MSGLTSQPSPIKAWVNFNGQGTVAIRSSDGVSSITDHGTGNYTVNFSSTLGSSDYAVFLTVGGASSFPTTGGQAPREGGTKSTSAVQVHVCYEENNSSTDLGEVSVLVVGN